MALLASKNLTFVYPDGSPCLRGVSMNIEPGQFVVLCGASGCGKTTLLRHCKTTLVPRGTSSGKVEFNGIPLEQVDLREQSSRIGFVQQKPGNQIVTDKVWHELAFGLESLGYENQQIRMKVAETASYFGIQTWFHRPVSELSGGEKQLLNLAAALTLSPSILILDEPTAQLDPIAAQTFLDTLVKINRELGTAILLSEHRMEEVVPLADVLMVMDTGQIAACGHPKEVCGELAKKSNPMFASMPTTVQVSASTGQRDNLPLTVRSGRLWLDDFFEKRNPVPAEPSSKVAVMSREKAIELREVWFAYSPKGPDIIRGLDMTVYTGEMFALVGGNGSGKTTVLNLLSGLNSPQRGNIRILSKKGSQIHPGMVSVLPQDPQLLFMRNTVSGELDEALDGSHYTDNERHEQIGKMVRTCQLESLLNHHPYDLSGGEQQRLALAKVLLTNPRLLLMDEPTKGLEQGFKDRLAVILEQLRLDGLTIVMVSHDIEFCARHANRCGLFFDGAIAVLGTPRQVLAENTYYTTAAHRMAGHLLPEALTAKDVIDACGGTPVELNEDKPKKLGPGSPMSNDIDMKKVMISRPVILSICMLLLCIPITIYFGITYLDDRKYLFISLLVLAEAIIPFFAAFERKKPRARELVVLAVLCSLAVIGRMIFFMVPQFKPVAALVIISGIALGSQTGFLVGAISAIASNLFYGQGPWTKCWPLGLLVSFRAFSFTAKTMVVQHQKCCHYV